MGKYLTPGQYLRSGDGMSSADPSLMPAETLASYILRAESDIDSYMGFDYLLGGFEPHVSWYQEAWDHSTLKTRIPNVPVPVRNVTRYRIQVSNVSQAGAGFFANINVGDVTFNVFQGYVEIVPLQAVTYAMTPVLVALGMNPPVVQVDYQVGFYFPFLGDTLFDSGDHLTYRAVRGFWASAYQTALSIQPNTLPPVPPAVYANGTPVGGYTVNYTEGSITFTVARSVSDVITADYTSQIPDSVKAAAVAQTSFLIGQADLNLQGMSGIVMARNEHQEIRRDVAFKETEFNTQHLNISRGAAQALARYQGIAIG